MFVRLINCLRDFFGGALFNEQLSIAERPFGNGDRRAQLVAYYANKLVTLLFQAFRLGDIAENQDIAVGRHFIAALYGRKCHLQAQRFVAIYLHYNVVALADSD